MVAIAICSFLAVIIVALSDEKRSVLKLLVFIAFQSLLLLCTAIIVQDSFEGWPTGSNNLCTDSGLVYETISQTKTKDGTLALIRPYNGEIRLYKLSLEQVPELFTVNIVENNDGSTRLEFIEFKPIKGERN